MAIRKDIGIHPKDDAQPFKPALRFQLTHSALCVLDWRRFSIPKSVGGNLWGMKKPEVAKSLI
jgi:hypothetical protein